ncbi:MAG: phosphoribosylanthranilate isomerase [Anaerolineae bacterium]|nr:phosphoribosylanthranilate isomerase [Anaerolineae bacterium]
MTAIKICGLGCLEDARHAWQCGANLLGFIFVPQSPRFLTPEQAREIIISLRREGCTARFVGVFAEETIEPIREVSSFCQLDIVQLHGKKPPPNLQELELPFILAWRMQGPIPWGKLTSYDAWAYLIDSYSPSKLGGTGQCWDWASFGTPPPKLRIIIAGGLTPENVTQAIKEIHPWGVDVSSGVEISPGRKDHDKIQRFIQNVRALEEKDA